MLKPSPKTLARREAFRKVGEQISAQAWRAHFGEFEYEFRCCPVHDDSRAFGGKLGKGAPQQKTVQFERTSK